MDAAKTAIPGDAGEVAERRELVSLRRRAYGADADIAGDAVALARLDELESRLLARFATPAPREPAVREPALPEAVAPVPAPASVDAPARSADARPEKAAPMPSRIVAAWRRCPRWLALLLGVLLGGLVAGALSLAGTHSADAALSPRADQDLEGRQVFTEYGSLDYLGVALGDLTLYDEYRGLDVWSAPSIYGTECLIITDAGDTAGRGLWGGNCAPAGMSPTVDLQNFSSFEHEVFADLPTGSIVRFALDGDRVTVRIGEAAGGGDPVIQQP